jgi:hypothetical protein
MTAHNPNEGKPMTISIVLEGQEFVALNGGPHFTFNPAVSFVVSCDPEGAQRARAGDGGHGEAVRSRPRRRLQRHCLTRS